jgi:SAM-dependent methyltransferase
MVQDVMGLTAAVSAASQTGLLASLVDGPPRTAAAHAAALSFDPRATALVLDVFVAFGLATRTGDLIAPSAELVQITSGAPGGMANVLSMWAHVPAFLTTGSPFMRMDGAREAAYAGVVATLGRMFAPVAAECAAQLPRSPARVLDIGCGSGVWSLAIGERHRDARITGLDLPAVLEAFRARAAELGLADRIDTIAGDVHEIAIPRAFDLVVIANVLRIEAPDRARAIVQRAIAALEPGGQLLVIDALSGGTPEREQARAVYALHLGMRTEKGRVYDRDQVGAWIREAGLSQHVALDFVSRPGAVGAILATLAP